MSIAWGDVVALVGAAAWVPQIWKLFQKPKVTVIVGGQVELGWTELGPIFNPRVAFRSERRDALITGISFVVRHEQGQEARFRATLLVELGPQGDYTTGHKFFQQRTQEVIALVVAPNAIAERKVQCRDTECIRDSDRRNETVGAAIARLRGHGDDWIDQVVRSQSYQEYRAFLDRHFFWQTGNYSVQCEVTVADQSTPTTCNFTFMITAQSIESLRRNAAIMEAGFRRGLHVDPDDTTNPEPYVWVYPVVSHDESSAQ